MLFVVSILLWSEHYFNWNDTWNSLPILHFGQSNTFLVVNLISIQCKSLQVLYFQGIYPHSCNFQKSTLQIYSKRIYVVDK